MDCFRVGQGRIGSVCNLGMTPCGLLSCRGGRIGFLPRSSNTTLAGRGLAPEREPAGEGGSLTLSRSAGVLK